MNRGDGLTIQFENKQVRNFKVFNHNSMTLFVLKKYQVKHIIVNYEE